MQPHIDFTSAEGDALSFETKALLDGRVAAEFDFAARTKNALPRQIEGTAQNLRDLARRAGRSRGPGDRPVG